MIKLYYTGSTSWKQMQTLSSKSIGGFISNTTVPNGLANSLFQNLGELDLWKDKVIYNYIGVAAYVFFFEGENESDYKNFLFKLEFDPEFEQYKDLFEFSVALAPLSGDDTNGYYMEQLRSIESKPYYLDSDFQILGEDIVRFLKVSTKGVGIWFRRKFNPIKAKELFGCQSDYWIENDHLPKFDFNLRLNFELENYDGDYLISEIGLKKIKPNSAVTLDNYTISIIDDNELTDYKITGFGDNPIVDLKVRIYATTHQVLITKELEDGLFEGRFDVTLEQLKNGLTFYVDDDGKVFYKYIKLEAKELFLGNDDVAVDYNYVYSNSFWVCYVNDTETRKY